WSGKEVRSPSPPPLRTVRAPCDAYGSSLHERPSRDAAQSVSDHPWSGSVDGNGRVTTPSCRASHRRLDCARSDGGCAMAALRPEGLARTTRIVPPVPPRDIRSGLDLPGYGSASSMTSPPDRVPSPDRKG